MNWYKEFQKEPRAMLSCKSARFDENIFPRAILGVTFLGLRSESSHFGRCIEASTITLQHHLD